MAFTIFANRLLWKPTLAVFLAAAAHAHATTYYIDFGAADDSKTGTSKSTPWKRCPGMAGFGGSYSHQAGDRFIFKGGVTWSKSCFQMKVTAGGSSDTNRDYYGVDQ